MSRVLLPGVLLPGVLLSGALLPGVLLSGSLLPVLLLITNYYGGYYTISIGRHPLLHIKSEKSQF